MTLLDYLKTLSTAGKHDFSVRCGTTFGYMKQVAYGNKLCGESLAIKIDRESSRAVRCEEIRPDVDWAYVRATTADKAAV